MELFSLIVSVIAMLVSGVAILQSAYFWRPIVTAAVKTHNVNVSMVSEIAYDLVLLNSGAIPARNVRIKADESSLIAAFGADATPENRESFLAAFKEETLIDLLQNGAHMSCSFGTSKNNDGGFWKYGASISIVISYERWFGKGWLEGWVWRRYTESQTIRILDSDSFTGNLWG